VGVAVVWVVLMMAVTLHRPRFYPVPRRIHRSAQKRKSANFACTEFSEVRIAPVRPL
jgi:hypothetical protein